MPTIPLSSRWGQEQLVSSSKSILPWSYNEKIIAINIWKEIYFKRSLIYITRKSCSCQTVKRLRTTWHTLRGCPCFTAVWQADGERQVCQTEPWGICWQTARLSPILLYYLLGASQKEAGERAWKGWHIFCYSGNTVSPQQWWARNH